MRGRAASLAAIVSTVLAACSAQQPTPAACVVAHVSGFVGAGGGQEHITVAQNGAPCEMATTIGRGPPTGGGEVVTPPAHGVASVRSSLEATVISYTPARDFVGSDRFVVAFGPNFTETVDVDVVPAPGGH